jgi:hypothetical protein
MTFSLFSAKGRGEEVAAAAVPHTTIAEGEEPRIAEVAWKQQVAWRGGAEEGESRVQCILFVFRTVFE